MPAKGPLKVEIAIGAAGRGKVVVDGVDISRHCRSITVQAEVGSLTTVCMTLGNVEVDGWVEVTSLSDDVRKHIPGEVDE